LRLTTYDVESTVDVDRYLTTSHEEPSPRVPCPRATSTVGSTSTYRCAAVKLNAKVNLNVRDHVDDL